MITITAAMLKASNKKIKRVWLQKAHEEANAVLYAMGRKPPRYPVPAIPTRVGWMPSGINGFVGRPYWYVSTLTYLWTFWKGLGLIEERVVIHNNGFSYVRKVPEVGND